MSEKLENNRYSADLVVETCVENMRIEIDWLVSQDNVIHVSFKWITLIRK
jgi:hypothetical protein